MKAAVVERFGEACSARTARSTGRRSGRSSSPTGPRSPGSSSSCTRASSRATSRWREELAALPDPPAVCVTEVPLLYEVGGESRFDKVVVVTASPEARVSRRIGPLREREQRLVPEEEKVEAGRLRLRERRHARRARRVRVRRHGHPVEMRVVLGGVLALWPPSSAASSTSSRRSRPGTSACATRSSTSTSSAGTPRSTTSTPACSRRSSTARAKFDADARSSSGRDRAHAAPARHRRGHRPAHRRQPLRGRRPLRPRRSTSATAPSTCAGCCRSTRTSASRWPPTTRARRTSTSGSRTAARRSPSRRPGSSSTTSSRRASSTPGPTRTSSRSTTESDRPRRGHTSRPRRRARRAFGSAKRSRAAAREARERAACTTRGCGPRALPAARARPRKSSVCA